MNAFDRAQENYDNQIPDPGVEWDCLDVTKLSNADKRNPYEMAHPHCGIYQVVEVYNKGFSISACYCQYCGEEVEIDDKIIEEILEKMGRE